MEMTTALSTSEIVRIIVYDEQHRKHVSSLLHGVSNVEFYVWQTDDVWIRDNGPIFEYDSTGQLVIQNWGFNGWGEKAKYHKCEQIPRKVADALGI